MPGDSVKPYPPDSYTNYGGTSYTPTSEYARRNHGRVSSAGSAIGNTHRSIMEAPVVIAKIQKSRWDGRIRIAAELCYIDWRCFSQSLVARPPRR